jgi:hypothetical protein
MLVRGVWDAREGKTAASRILAVEFEVEEVASITI